jgi:hypothetical protein
MKISTRVLAGLGFTAGLMWLVTSASGGRFGGGGGGFRGGGGGGFHGGSAGGFRPSGGGFSGGGFSGGGFHPSQPMSRPEQFSRPSFESGGGRAGAVNGPYGGTFGNRGAETRPGAGGSGERHVWQTPRGGTVIGGGGERSFTGPGGNTYSGGGGHYAYTGPHGAVAVGGGKGGTITLPGGKSISGGEAGHVVIGPNGNVNAGGTRGAAVKGPNGAAIAGSHGAVTAGPDGAVARGSRGAAVTGAGGTAIAGQRGAVAVGPYGAAARGGSVVAGRTAAGGAFVGTRHVNAVGLANQGTYVRRNFGYYNAFTRAWYNRYPGAWFAAGWATGAVWRAATWGGCASYVGYPEDVSPVYYNYGDNVTYQDGNVYYGDDVAYSEADYSQQASQIADTGRQANPPGDQQWQPLGVFAMTKGDETTSNDIFQLAIDKDGIVRGNYYNAVNDSTTPVYGSLDKKTQRLAWTIGDQKTPVYETGLYNLTLEQTTLLAHFALDRTEQYNLFRIEQPKEDKAGLGQ